MLVHGSVCLKRQPDPAAVAPSTTDPRKVDLQTRFPLATPHVILHDGGDSGAKRLFLRRKTSSGSTLDTERPTSIPDHFRFVDPLAVSSLFLSDWNGSLSEVGNLLIFRNIQSIHFNDCDLKAANLAWLMQCKDLKSIQISGAEITRDLANQLSRISSVTHIDLGLYRGPLSGKNTPPQPACRMSGDAYRCIGAMPQLTSIKLRGVSISDNHLIELLSKPSLEEIDLEETLITDAALPHLQQVRSLRRLILPANVSTQVDAFSESKQPRSIARNACVTSAGVIDLATKRSDLSITYFHDPLCDLVDARATQVDDLRDKLINRRFLRSMPTESGEHLALSNIRATDFTVWAISRSNQFVWISLGNCPITDFALTALAGQAELQILDISGTTAVSPGGLRELNNLANLNILCLDSHLLTDEGIEAIKSIEKLRHLHIFKNGNQAVELSRLQQQLPNCTVHMIEWIVGKRVNAAASPG